MGHQIVLAFSLASAQRADSLKIAQDLRLDTRKFRPIQIYLLQPPGQEVRRFRPFAGENRELGSANAQVARDVLHLGRTAAIKLRQPSASAAPGPPPTAKSVNESRPFIGLGCTAPTVRGHDDEIAASLLGGVDDPLVSMILFDLHGFADDISCVSLFGDLI
jgi:hypothetical protein